MASMLWSKYQRISANLIYFENRFYKNRFLNLNKKIKDITQIFIKVQKLTYRLYKKKSANPKPYLNSLLI